MEVFRCTTFRNKFVTALSACRCFSSSPQNIPEKQPPFIEAEKKREAWTILHFFSSKKSQFLELHRINPLTMTGQRYREWKEKVKREIEIEGQKFIEERHNILGSDLAAAHFIVFRGGKVRFQGSDRWIEKKEGEDNCPELPNRFIRNLYLDSIDASNTNIRYEGLVNLTNLAQLKWLSFKNNKNVDSWFLDRITGEFPDTLEYLDISGCEGVTEESLTCIYRLRNLRTLKVSNIHDSRSFEFMCLLLEDSKPNLTIEGIKYISVESN